MVGGAGREHALVWKLARSGLTKKLFAAPGNPGISEIAECLPLKPEETVALADFALSSKVDLVLVGPEGPLVHGMVDYFQERGVPIFGPSKAAARLEGSKAFAKELMRQTGVPTAEFQIFADVEEALAAVQRSALPVVVKADGLAAGKGAVVAQTREEAIQAVTEIMKDRIFGEAGAQVVIEEYLEGEEASVLALVDGQHLALLDPSQDHKRAFDHDQGPNTGGMGAYSPVPAVGARQMEEIRRRIYQPVVRAMAEQGTPFRGVLYAGLMLTAAGPKVLEFNVRFGDPESQALLPRLKSDLVELMLACLEGKLDRVPLAWDPRSCACVVLASGGYPTRYDLGREITGLERAAEVPDALLFHAGTRREKGRLFTSGGRVLNAVGMGPTLEEALARAYEAVELVHFEGKQFRRDIGARAMKMVKGAVGGRK